MKYKQILNRNKQIFNVLFKILNETRKRETNILNYIENIIHLITFTLINSIINYKERIINHNLPTKYIVKLHC